MATWREMDRRRDEFFKETFDAMVEKIIDLESEVESLTDEVASLKKELADAQEQIP